ncbi:hypothetical protein MKW98_026135 [Papaver atlanticum]|uniref:Uncharacterized protein n=1 Tax=Papaver atlanticum TaxID=357466 RepID=A0AAD4RYJ2_9MAGN|nr:hypothetical protein MKW98_026135 [Papaver atlanticum]
MKHSLIWSRISTKRSLIWLRKSMKESLIWFKISMKRSLICLRESMELDQQEAAAASLRIDPIVLARKSITLFAEGISLMIPSQQTEVKVAVPNFEKKRFNGMAECLRCNSDEFKQKIVKEMAAEILSFFIQPEERCSKKVRCGVEHVEFLLHELVRISFTYTIGKSTLEATDILFNLHQDFLPGKHKVVKELGKTLCWTGKDHEKKLRKDEELELIRAHRANRDRKTTRRQRLKFRAYFV